MHSDSAEPSGSDAVPAADDRQPAVGGPVELPGCGPGDAQECDETPAEWAGRVAAHISRLAAAAAAGTGRPSKLREAARIARLLAGLAAGATREGACAAAGVSFAGFRAWMVAGEHAAQCEDNESPFLAFMEAIETAEASSEVSLVEIIRNASQTKWVAAAWLLERRWPARYGRRLASEVRIDDQRDSRESEIWEDALRKRTDEELDRIIALTEHTEGVEG
ncbi:MAG: hypothetical protein K1X74_14185 [Pirellulales bacterium]|nr:hypothetical protein [Pirellulales bacterium]